MTILGLEQRQHAMLFCGPKTEAPMKLSTLLLAATCSTALFAQTTVTISTGPSNAMQSYYSLANGEESSPALAEWDIAIEVTGIAGSILANTANGVRVYKAPYTIAQWAMVDTTGLASTWPAQYNSETNWSAGAFNHGLSSAFDLGWGTYNPVTHNIPGDSCFVLMLPNGAWKKFRMDGFVATSNTFTFTWADLDGGNEQSGSLLRSGFPGKDFGYYSLTNNAVVDHEPVADSWDLLFSKYIAFVPQPVPSYYPVAGVVMNRQVTALQVDGVPSVSAAYWGQPFSSDIDVIGYDWKNFNQTTFMWEYAADRTYFVQARNGDIWKLVFQSYGGGANGNFTFTQERVGIAGVDEPHNTVGFTLFPNPSQNGSVQLVMDAPVTSGTVSIHDASGKLVAQQRLNGSASTAPQTINVQALQPGLYLVRMSGEGLNATSRLVIQ